MKKAHLPKNTTAGMIHDRMSRTRLFSTAPSTVTKRLRPSGGVSLSVPVMHLSVTRTLGILPASIISWNWLWEIASTCWRPIRTAGSDRTLVMVMVDGIGAHLTNDEKRAHLIDLKRDHLIDQVCVQEVLPPEK